MSNGLTPISWRGSSKDDLLEFPSEAIQDAGYQLHRLQEGNEPQDWKAIKGLGKGITGVYEIRIWDDHNTYRVAYVTKFKGYIAVLHCWHKTTQTIEAADKAKIVERYKLAAESLK